MLRAATNKWVNRCAMWCPGHLGAVANAFQGVAYAANGQWRNAAGSAFAAGTSYAGGRHLRSITRTRTYKSFGRRGRGFLRHNVSYHYALAGNIGAARINGGHRSRYGGLW